MNNSDKVKRNVLIFSQRDELVNAIENLLPDNFEIKCSSNYAADINDLLDWNPSVLLLTSNTPFKKTVELYHELKSHPKMLRIPIIFCTTLHTNSLQKNLQGVAPADILIMPFEFDDLINKLEEKILNSSDMSQIKTQNPETN